MLGPFASLEAAHRHRYSVVHGPLGACCTRDGLDRERVRPVLISGSRRRTFGFQLDGMCRAKWAVGTSRERNIGGVVELGARLRGSAHGLGVHSVFGAVSVEAISPDSGV